MRLSSLVPLVSADAVAHLEAAGIRTDADLVFTPLFDIFKRLPSNTLSLQELAELCSLVTNHSAAEPLLATDLLLDAEASVDTERFDLSVGDKEIDAFLRGLGGRSVIEISGDRSTGKTVRSWIANLQLVMPLGSRVCRLSPAMLS